MRLIMAILCATVAAPAMAHDPIDWQGDEIHVLLEKDGTGGDMGMFTVTTKGPGGPPRHVHDDAGEALYMLEGDAEFLADGETFTVKQGEVGFVPQGAEHTFRVLDEDGGKLLVIVTPGGFEGFFDASKGLKLPDEMEKMNEISEEYGQRFTGPPLEAK